MSASLLIVWIIFGFGLAMAVALVGLVVATKRSAEKYDILELSEAQSRDGDSNDLLDVAIKAGDRAALTGLLPSDPIRRARAIEILREQVRRRA